MEDRMKKTSILAVLFLLGGMATSGWCDADREVAVEWINICNPCGNNDLSCRDDVAVRFYNILRDNGYVGLFNFGNSLAWESDFKEPGDQNWIDKADIALHADHGNRCRFAFGNTTHDDCRLWADEAGWGNKDLEWIIFDDCSCVQHDFQWTCWEDAFRGLHLIASFDTNAHDMCDRGEYFANKLVDGWTLMQAWFYAAEQTEGAGTFASVMGANKGSINPASDHIWGFGSQSADPYPADSYWCSFHDCD